MLLLSSDAKLHLQYNSQHILAWLRCDNCMLAYDSCYMSDILERMRGLVHMHILSSQHFALCARFTLMSSLYSPGNDCILIL